MYSVAVERDRDREGGGRESYLREGGKEGRERDMRLRREREKTDRHTMNINIDDVII